MRREREFEKEPGVRVREYKFEGQWTLFSEALAVM